MDGVSAQPAVIADDSRISEDTRNSELDVDGSAAAPVPAQVTPEELVAKAIAPVKREFLRPPPVRASSATNTQNDDVAEAKSASLVKEKKSKRQLKRERRQVPLFIHNFVCAQ